MNFGYMMNYFTLSRCISGLLLVGLGLVAQAAEVSTTTDTVKGRAPNAANTEIVNLTRPASPVSTGYEIEGKYTYVDPDGDTESGSVVRWLRDGVEVARGSRYTTGVADADKNLVFEVEPKSADPSDPDTGPVTSATVLVGLNHAPVASNVTLVGTPVVGQTLTASYVYSDADGDLEGATSFDWCWSGEGCGKGTEQSYTLTDIDVGKLLEFYITPKSATGTPTDGIRYGAYQAPDRVQRMITATANQDAQMLVVGQTGYSFSPLTAVTGGTAPYTYEVQSGTLPAGLALNATTGVVSGTPTTVQTAANVVFRVKDANGVAALTTSSVSYEVTDPVTSIEITGLVGGYPQVGSQLTATPSCGGRDCGPGRSHQWKLETGVGTGQYNNINGATAATYTPVKGDQKRKVGVSVN